MICVLKYIILTLKHKWFVFQAGVKLKVSIIRLIKHDLSKFFPSELPYYGKQFFGEANDPQGFARCWLKHQNRNDHHWEYWISRTGHNQCDPLIEMPEQAVREMVADWLGASRAYEGRWPDLNNWKWFKDNIRNTILHHNTRILINQIIEELNDYSQI